MADAQVLYDEDVAATVATDTAWVTTALIPAASFTANKRYLILASEAVGHSSAANESRVRLAHGSTPTVFTDASLAWEGIGSEQGHQAQWMFDFTQPGTAEDVLIQISSSSTTDVTNKLGQILVIKLDDDFVSGTDYFWAEDLTDYTMTATPTAKATTASFTPNGSDRWLFIGHMIYDVVGITTQIGFELYDSVAGVLNSESHEGEDATNDFHGHNLYWVGVPTNAARTLAVRPFNSGSAIMLASRVIAINLAKFAQSAGVFDAAEVDPATTPTYTNLATLSVTPDVTGDWVYIAFTNNDVNESTTNFDTRVRVNPDGAALIPDPDYPAGGFPGVDEWDITDETPHSIFKMRSFTSGAARPIEFDARQAAGTTGRLEDNGLVAFSVALAGGGTTVSPGANPLTLGQPAPQLNLNMSPGAIALGLSLPAPGVTLVLSPGAIALALGQPAPQTNLAIAPPANPLALDLPPPNLGGVQTLEPGAIALSLDLPAPTTSLGLAPPANPLSLDQPAPTTSLRIVPDPVALAVGQPAPVMSGVLSPGAIALSLDLPAPTITAGTIILSPDPIALALDLPAPAMSGFLSPGAIALALGQPAPSIQLVLSPGAIALALGLPVPTITVSPLTLSPGAIALVLGIPVPTITVFSPPGTPSGRIRDITYHAVIFNPSATGGPGTPKYELDADLLNVVWQQGLNFPGQAAFSLSRFNPKLAGFDYMRDHIKIWREDSRATKVVFAGKLVRPSVSAQDAIIYCWDYMAFLQRSRTGFRTLYPEKTIKEVVDAEWALAKAADKSLFEFVATGTTETPLGLDGTTPIKTNNQFGVIDFDRLYLFFAMAEISMANTSNTVVFEITREEPHTFNFWKNRSADKTAFNFVFPGNLIDYDLDTGHDQIVNDLATVIVDPTTGAQVEYALTDTASKDLYRRLQSATTIRTLFGLNSGSTESDQQKAALARLLTISAGIPRILTAFPRQGEITPFHGWELGDAFRSTIQKADRSGDEIDAYLNATGVAAAWTPEAGELMQIFLR